MATSCTCLLRSRSAYVRYDSTHHTPWKQQGRYPKRAGKGCRPSMPQIAGYRFCGTQAMARIPGMRLAESVGLQMTWLHCMVFVARLVRLRCVGSD